MLLLLDVKSINIFLDISQWLMNRVSIYGRIIMAATMHYKLKPDANSAETFPLREIVRKRIQHYYKMVSQEGLNPDDVYDLIMEETECPMIEETMDFTGGNQSRSARILGLNRGTFRKKLEQYNMLKDEEPSAFK